MMDPLTEFEMWCAKKGIYLVGILLLILIFVGWLGYNSWRNSRNHAQQIQAVTDVGNANTSGGQHAVNTTQANQDKNDATDKKTAAIVNNFNTYPAAKNSIDPAFMDNFKHGVCMYVSAADLPECGAMQPVRP